MVSHVKRFSLSVVTCLVAVFAVFALLQFASPSAAQAPAGLASPSPSASEVGSWLLVNNLVSSNLRIVNTANNQVYGPFLQDQLGTGGSERLDIAVTPDGRTALLSSFEDRAVFLVNVSDPIHPSVITSVTLPFYAEDIDISHDGQYALVTDGSPSSVVAAINLLSPTQVITADLGSAQAQAVAIAPDGTIILVDTGNHTVHSIRLSDMLGGITATHTYTVPYPGVALTDTANLPIPVNVGVAPDGQTVIVCSGISETVDIFRIVSPGVLTSTGVITGLHGTDAVYTWSTPGVQSVAFNAAGTKAYAVVNNILRDYHISYGDRLAVLNITGPGQVSLAAGGVVTLPHYTSGWYFGVDTLAVAGNKVYLGYPMSLQSDDLTSLAVVDLTDYSVTSTMVLSKSVSYPTGVAVVVPLIRVYLPVILR